MPVSWASPPTGVRPYLPTGCTSFMVVCCSVNCVAASTVPRYPPSPEQYAQGHARRICSHSYSATWPSSQVTSKTLRSGTIRQSVGRWKTSAIRVDDTGADGHDRGLPEDRDARRTGRWRRGIPRGAQPVVQAHHRSRPARHPPVVRRGEALVPPRGARRPARGLRDELPAAADRRLRIGGAGPRRDRGGRPRRPAEAGRHGGAGKPDRLAHHSKKLRRSSGQKRRSTFPMIRSFSCEPKERESEDAVRLSPMAKNSPSGTV